MQINLFKVNRGTWPGSEEAKIKEIYEEEHKANQASNPKVPKRLSQACEDLKGSDFYATSFRSKLNEGSSFRRTKNCKAYLQSYYDVIYPNGNASM